MADAICPTFAAGTISDLGVERIVDDVVNNPYQKTVGSFNNSWANGALSNTVLPTFSTSLVDFGNTGRQS